jgi:hypothetical protein
MATSRRSESVKISCGEMKLQLQQNVALLFSQLSKSLAGATFSEPFMNRLANATLTDFVQRLPLKDCRRALFATCKFDRRDKSVGTFSKI